MMEFANWSIRRKLKWVSMLTSTVALVMACAVFFGVDYGHMRRALESEMESSAEIVGGNATAAITFGDQAAAAGILASLRTEPHLEVAALYAADGKELARYVREAKQACPASAPAVGTVLGSGRLEVARDVMMDGRVVGRVYLRSDLGELNARMRSYLIVLGTVLAGALAVAFLLSSRLERVISGPVLELTGVARQVTAEQDFAVRAVKHGEDELGALIDCFNGMLAQIQARDEELQLHRTRLEEQVAQRTGELQRANEDLSAAKGRAESANRAKSAFLANMSHEIRTPMTAILGYADVMLDPKRTLSDRADCLQVIRRNAQHLLELINDILDISKIEADKMTVERIPCELPRVIVDVTSMLRPRATGKGLSLTAEFVGAIPREITTDPLRLKQVLMNLVGNAIKFTDDGGVTLRVSAQKHGASSRVRFEIADTGIGMTGEQMERLFQPFVQADGSMTRKYGGSGLGLAISKQLVALMGGTVMATSEAGKGSTFVVEIDGGDLSGVEMLEGLTESLLQPTPAMESTQEVRLDGARVLLAEDGIDNQHLITMHLTAAGAEVVVAENGRVAVERLKAAAAPGERGFDVVLMDMQMPVLDGYGAASELRAKGFAVPIVALTAHAMVGDREKCIAAGCTDYATKPIDREMLLRTVGKYVRRGEGVGAGDCLGLGAGGSAPLNEARQTGMSAPPDAGACVKSTVAMPGSAAAAEAMRRAVEGFVGRLPQRVDELRRLAEVSDLAELGRMVHQLKGAGSGYGFPTITQNAARAEQMIKTGAAVEAVRAGVEELIGLIRRVEGYQIEKETYASARAGG